MANFRPGRWLICSAFIVGLTTASVTVSGYIADTSTAYHDWYDLATAPAVHAEIIIIRDQHVEPPIVCQDMKAEGNTPDVVARCRSPGL